MPFKDAKTRKEYQREYARKHYLANIEKIKAKSRVRNVATRKRNRDFILSIKDNAPCADCGKKYPYYVMQFDHIYEKSAAIANLVRSGVSLKRLQNEVDKCELVCANCHAERTFERLLGDEDMSEWL